MILSKQVPKNSCFKFKKLIAKLRNFVQIIIVKIIRLSKESAPL
jgi:hypothetical protein